MTPDEAEFTAYLAHPDTNKLAFEALLAECMADADQRAVMTVLKVVLREEQ